MNSEIEISIIWICAAILTLLGMMFLTFAAMKYAARSRRLVTREISKNKSLSSRYGKMTEQFLPLIDVYPWNPRMFRFLGSPIDGVQFNDDKVLLLEFKTGKSQLSKTQKHIKALVDQKKVEFEVIKLSN